MAGSSERAEHGPNQWRPLRARVTARVTSTTGPEYVSSPEMNEGVAGKRRQSEIMSACAGCGCQLVK